MLKQKLLLLLLGFLGFLLLGTAAMFFTHKNTPQPIPPSSMPTPSTVASGPTRLPPVPIGPSGGTHPEVRRVTLDDAKSAFDTSSAIFLDVRSPSYYTFSHIPGAVNIPLADIATRLNELDPGQWIITYCT